MKKVLMIGPGRNVQGGISTVVNNYYSCELDNLVDLEYLSTMEDGSKLKKIVVFLISFLSFIFKNNYEILHVHMASRSSFKRKSFFLKIASLKKKKIVLHLHGAEFKEFYYNESNIKQKKNIKKIFELSNKVIALSEEWKDFLKKLVPEEKIEVIHNSIKLYKRDKNKSYDQNKIVFLGRLGQRKGAYDLIDIVPQLVENIKNLKVYLLGDGELDDFKKIIKKLKIEEQVKILGWVRGREKEKILRESTIFVLPSYNEGMPMSLLEAMSYQLPVVTTNVGGIPQVIDQNGYMIKPGDKEALFNSLKELCMDKEKKVLFGKRSYQIVSDKFNLETVVNKLVKIYKEI